MILTIDPASHSGDDFRLRMTVRPGVGAPPLDLTGAVVEAQAELGGLAVAPASVTITDAAAGEVLIDFERKLTALGTWLVQARVTLDGHRETVLYRHHRVKETIL